MVTKLLGKVLTEVIGAQDGSYKIIFKTACGRTYKMYHEQDCCENVYLEDVCGDVSDLIGRPIILAEEVSNSEDLEFDCSCTWTSYKIGTTEGVVTLRWYGESNGYYSERVDFEEIETIMPRCCYRCEYFEHEASNFLSCILKQQLTGSCEKKDTGLTCNVLYQIDPECPLKEKQ